MSDETVFDLARKRKDVGAVLGAPCSVRWRRLKRCPLCEGKDDFSYTASAWRCWKCGEHGDVIALAALLWSMSRFDAACALAGVKPEEVRAGEREKYKSQRSLRPRALPRAAPAHDDGKREMIAGLLAGAVAARGTPVETYLASRGIDPRRVEPALDRLLYNPRAFYARGVTLPALIARVEGAAGLHCTYLRADGAGKAEVMPAKKMWGPQTDGMGRACGIVLAPPASDAPLIVAEGIENALSVLAWQGAPLGFGAFAAGSLDRLQGGMMAGVWGGADWRAPRPDPARPAATIRHRGPVIIAVDGDMAALTLQPGTKWEKHIAPERRAQVSGVLAAHWWRRAGASEVRVVMPELGYDANDVLRAAQLEAAQ